MSTISQTLAPSRTHGLRGFVKPAKALELKDQVALALDTLRKNPLRSALTILGIVIGITSIVGITSCASKRMLFMRSSLLTGP